LTPDRIEARLGRDQLTIMGGLHEEGHTLYLIGAAEPGFWTHLTSNAEWQDGAADPIDRWSQRVLTAAATELGAQPVFPFWGPPWHPFYRWALHSGQAWESPLRLLVHAEAGVFASYRGALKFHGTLPLPEAQPRPCDSCADKPCLTACPATALTGDGYDLPSCHRFLDEPAGVDCMNDGCAVRRACPVSRSYARLPSLSAYHMRQFHK
jgi:epoxyqueuosine reductase